MGPHARVFSQTFAHGNSKNERRQRNRGRRQQKRVLSSKSTAHGSETWLNGLAVWLSPLAEWLALARTLHHCQKPQYVQLEKYMYNFFKCAEALPRGLG